MKNKIEIDCKDCFARLSEKECNALICKECKNCSFYKAITEEPNYYQWLPYQYKNIFIEKYKLYLINQEKENYD